MSHAGTGYDWITKSYSLNRVIETVTLKKGTSFALLELNKVAGLTSLTCIMFAWLPLFENKSKSLLLYSMIIGIGHTSFSMNKFFGYSVKKILDSKTDMKLAVVMGVCVNSAMVLGYLGKLQSRYMMMVGIFGGSAHYYFMKTSQSGGNLSLKPFAYVPLLLFPVAVYYQWKSGNITL